MSKRLISGFVAAFLLAAPVQAEDGPALDTVIATVNGTEITLGHMAIVRQQLPQQYTQLPADVLFQGILDQLVQQTVLSQTIPDELPLRARLSLENEERALRATEAIGSVIEGATTDEAIAAAYEARYAEAEPESEFNASHILVETEEEAKAVKAELDGGADFAETAKAKSTGPSGPNGGQLGWFGKGMMVAPFEEAAMALEKGQISEPVQTQFGWHVIILNDTRMKDVPALDTVRDEIRDSLQQEAVEAHIGKLTEAAEVVDAGVEVDPAILSDITLFE